MEEQLSLDLGGERDPRDVTFSGMVREFARVTDQQPDQLSWRIRYYNFH